MTQGALSNGGATPLDVWIHRHGPLPPSQALLVVLYVCSRLSSMPDSELGAAVASLTPRHIVRRPGADWEWQPASSTSVRAAAIDRQAFVFTRLGAILFYVLSGKTLDGGGDDQALRTELLALRPDLHPAVVDVTVRAVTADHSRRLTLEALSSELRQLIGVTSTSRGAVPRARRWLARGAVAVFVIAAAWLVGARAGAFRDSHGLTAEETDLLDVLTESSHVYALMDEHTASVIQHQHIRRLWSAWLSPEDPRLMLITAHEAWVKGLADDLFSAEQLLADAPRGFAERLGAQPPYTRAVRLNLAAVLEARGAHAEAAALRAEADLGTRALLLGGKRATDVAEWVPTGPGVIAHVAPLGPDAEGFRRASARFVKPLTSAQRLVGERRGWRLHLVARNACDVSVDIGNIPRRMSLAAVRDVDRSWQVDVRGLDAPIKVRHADAPALAVSVIANAAGEITVRWGDDEQTRRIDIASAIPAPPYMLSFNDRMACAVVWLEIPVPWRAADVHAMIATPR